MKRTVLAVALAGTAVLLAGCAMGRGPMGEIVMGVDLGKLPESASEIGGVLASAAFGPQVGTVVSSVLATVLGGGSVAVAGTKIAGRERRRKEADQGREKAEKEAIALKAILNATGVLKPQPAPPKEDPVDPDA